MICHSVYSNGYGVDMEFLIKPHHQQMWYNVFLLFLIKEGGPWSLSSLLLGSLDGLPVHHMELRASQPFILKCMVTANLGSPINLSLDFWRNPKYLQRTHASTART